MFHRFQYEAEFYSQLDRLPLHARMKLDLTGIKLSLNQWLAFSLAERKAICHLPIESEEELQVFIEYMNFLCLKYNGGPAEVVPPMSPAPWDTAGQIPPLVVEKSREDGQGITLEEWARWRFYERYALYKTAVSKSEPEKFFAVLKELRQWKNGS
jgi:hypothetical protein